MMSSTQAMASSSLVEEPSLTGLCVDLATVLVISVITELIF